MVLLAVLGLAIAADRSLEHDEADTEVHTPSPEVLWVEQARLALARERPDLSRRYAMRALSEDPGAWDAWRLYLRASSRAGLREVAEAELEALDDPGAAVALAWWKVANDRAPVDSLEDIDDPRAKVAWGYSVLARGREGEVLALDLPDDALAGRLRLRALAMTGDAKGLHAEAMAWWEEHPDRPDVLEELWRKGAPETKARKKLSKALIRRASTEDDPAWLSLASRTLVQAKQREAAEEVAARIDALGLLAPLPRKPWGGPMRKAMAKAIVGQQPEDLPEGSEAERVAVAWAVSDAWLVRDRAEDALALWDHLGSQRWQAGQGRARVLEALDQGDAAQAARRSALMATVGPWATDPCGLDRAGRLAAFGAITSDGDVDGSDAVGHALTALAPWSTLLADLPPTPAAEELAACIDAQSGSPMAAAWVGPRADVAATVLPRLYEEAIARIPEDVLQSAAPTGVVGEGRTMPALTLRLDDGDRDFAELASEPGPMVLTLWASWCGPCQTELPLMDELAARLATEGVAVQPIAISIDEDPRPYRRRLQRKPFATLRTGRDPGLLTALGGSSLPVTWVIDDDAVVRLVHVGYDPDLPSRVEALVREMEDE